MKSLVTTFYRCASVALLLCTIAATAQAQTNLTSGKLQFDSLDRLGNRAAETVNVNMDERLLRIVPPILSKADPEEENVKKLVADLKGVYVRHFQFDAENEYAETDVAQVRAQLSAPGWTRIVEVKSRREGKNVEVYLLTNGGRVEGLAVLSLEPKELTVVNIVGSVDLERLSRLEGQFGIPDLELETETKAQPKKH